MCGSIGPSVGGCQSLDKLLIHRLVLVFLISLLAVGPLVGWSVPLLVSWFVASLVSPSVSGLSSRLACPLVGKFVFVGPSMVVVWSLSLHVGQVCSSIGQSLGQVFNFFYRPISWAVCCLLVGQLVCQSLGLSLGQPVLQSDHWFSVARFF